MSSKGSLIGRVLIPAFGGLYNDLIGRRTHLGVAAVIFDNQGSVLLVHQSYGHRGWDLPGGGREAKESLHDAIRREVREEVGLEITSAELTGVYYEPGVDQHHFTFRCEVQAVETAKATPPEILEVGFFAPNALPRPVNDFTIQQIEDALFRKPVTVQVLGKRQWMI
jgi:8-oxo-dGTP pyrophosphatase MutT (NUDIX family)